MPVHHAENIAQAEAAIIFERATFARTTGPAGETMWNERSLEELGANGRRGVITESSEAWMKFRDGSGMTIKMDDGG